MKLTVLKKAIEALKVQEGLQSPSVYDEYLEQIDEVITLTGQPSGKDPWAEECCVLHMDSIVDLINRDWYDIYGLEARKNGGNVSLDDFQRLCRDYLMAGFGYNCWPTEALLAGYNLLHDLWIDNEKAGGNFPDGTHKPFDISRSCRGYVSPRTLCALPYITTPDEAILLISILQDYIDSVEEVVSHDLAAQILTKLRA